MTDFVQIRSVKQYFNEYAVNGIGKGSSKSLIREQLIDAFQKEIFGQLMMKFKDPELLAKDISTVDPKTKEQVDHIISNSVRKWKRLCMLFAQYRETHDVIMPSDLMVTLEDIVNSQISDASLNESMEVEPEEDETDIFEERPIEPGQEYPPGYWFARGEQKNKN